MRQTPRGRLHAARVDTVRLGAKRAPTPAVSDMRGTWKPRRGPLVLLVRAGGGLTVREAEFPGGTGRLKKRRPVGRKARGNRDGLGRCLFTARSRVTRRIPVRVTGPERALTWAG